MINEGGGPRGNRWFPLRRSGNRRAAASAAAAGAAYGTDAACAAASACGSGDETACGSGDDGTCDLRGDVRENDGETWPFIVRLKIFA